MPLLPLIPLQVVYVVLVLGAAVLGVGIVVSLKPGVLGKLRFRQPTKKVEDELTKVLEEVGERTEEGPEVSQAGKPEAVSKAGKPEPVSKAGKPEPVTPKSIRLTPETLKKIKRERR